MRFLNARLLVPLCSLLVAISAAAGEPAAAAIAETVKPLTIDGVLDEPAWSVATPIVVNRQHADGAPIEEGRFMTVRYVWDSRFLYIGYEVADTELVAVTDNRMKGPSSNRRRAAVPWGPEKSCDVAEFQISLTSQQFVWELQHNAANDLNDVMFIGIPADSPLRHSSLDFMGTLMHEHEFIRDGPGGATVQTAVTLLPRADGKPSTVNDSTDTDTGYVGEIRLPWHGLGVPKAAAAAELGRGHYQMAGRELWMCAVVLNGNGKTYRYHHNCPRLPPKGLFAANVEHFERFRLISAAR
jgi:hypothetical protein